MVPSRKSQVTWGPSMQFWSLRAWKLGVKLWVFESFRVGKKFLPKNKRGANPTTKLLEVMHMSRSKFIYLGLPIFGFETVAFKHLWPPLQKLGLCLHVETCQHKWDLELHVNMPWNWCGHTSKSKPSSMVRQPHIGFKWHNWRCMSHKPMGEMH